MVKIGEGIRRAITIDGDDVDGIAPESISAPPQPLTSRVELASGGSRTFQRFGLGLPAHRERYSFDIPWGDIVGAPQTTKDQLEWVRVSGGFHTLAIWRPMGAVYRPSQARSHFRLPQYRRNAPQALTGLSGVSVGSMPFQAWLTPSGGAEVALAVSYENGPTVSSPGPSNSLIVGRDPHISGEWKDYVEFRTNPSVGPGDVLKILWVPLFVAELTESGWEFPLTRSESWSWTFLER